MPTPNPWILLALITLVQGAMSMASFVWGPLAPYLVAEYGLTGTQVGTVSAAFYIVAAGMAIPGGLLVDRVGSRLPMVACQFVAAAPLAALCFAPSFPLLLVGVAFCGLGYSAINQASARGVVYAVPPRRLGLAMGVRQTGNMVGGAVAASLLPAFAAWSGWRAGILAIAACIALSGVVAWTWYRESAPAGEASDRLSSGGNESSGAKLLRLLRQPALLFLLVLSPLMGYGQIAMLSFFALYVSDGLRHGPVAGGTCLTAAMLAAGAGRIGWGVMGDRYFGDNAAYSLALVLALATLGIAALAILPAGTPLPIVALLGVLVGATAMGWHGLLLVALTAVAGKQATATALGMLINAAWLGWILGPIAFGYAVDHAGYGAAWASAVVTSAVSAASFALLGARRGRVRGPR